MKSKKVRIFSIILVAVLAAGSFLGYRYYTTKASSSSAASAQTVKVAKGTVSTSVAAAGNVRGKQSVSLSWQTSGVVGTVSVKVGDVVKAGQVLASLDPSQLPQSIISAQTDMAQAQESLDELMNTELPRAQAMQAVDTAQQALDDYQNNFPALQGQAWADLVTAQQTLTTTVNKRIGLNNARATQATIDSADARYELALQAANNAQKSFDAVADLPADSAKRALALTRLSDAEAQRDAALATLNWYLGRPNNEDIAAADAAVAQAKADVATKQSAWAKVKNGPNATELALLQATLDDAKRSYDKLTNGPDPNDVAVLKNRIASDQNTINQQNIISQFSGTVTDINTIVGDQVSAGKTAFRIDNISELFVDVNVAEVDVAKVKPGQTVNLSFDALSGKKFTGKVVEVLAIGTSTQGVVQFPVTVVFSDTTNMVKLGMTAAASILTAQKTNVLMVPNRAIHKSSGQSYVVVLNQGNQISVPVSVGLAGDSYSEINSQGLKEGDLVVVNATTTTTSSSRTTGGFGGDMGAPPSGGPLP